LLHDLKQWVRQMWLFPTMPGAEHHLQKEVVSVVLAPTPFRLSYVVQSFASIVLLGYEIMYDTPTYLFLAFQLWLSGISWRYFSEVQRSQKHDFDPYLCKCACS
jgi:hypothetical protein